MAETKKYTIFGLILYIFNLIKDIFKKKQQAQLNQQINNENMINEANIQLNNIDHKLDGIESNINNQNLNETIEDINSKF